MDKEKLKKEAVCMAVLFAVTLAIFQAVFYKENILTTARTVASVFWLFVLPGFSIMYLWHDKLDFLQRTVAGTVLATAITGIIGYNASLLGLHIRYHAVILPAAMYIIAAFAIRRMK